jgi:hypothetical protein
MADPNGWEAEWSEEDDELSDDSWLENGAFDFEWEPDEPESWSSRLIDRWERFLALVPGSRQYWSRLQESVEERVGWRLEAFQEMTSLSARQKQSLLPRVFAIEEVVCSFSADEKELTGTVVPSLAALIAAVVGALAPLAANAWWVGGEYPFLAWALLCCATLVAGAVLGLGALVLALGGLSVVPRPIRRLLVNSTPVFIVPAVGLPGLALLGFWLARAVAALGAGGSGAWSLLSVAVPLAGLGATLVFVGAIVVTAMWHFVYAGRVARRHTQDLIPYVLLNLLKEAETWQDSWDSAIYRRDLAGCLDGVADLLSRWLPRHLGTGDPITDAWVRTMTAEMSNHLRWLKTHLLLPEPGGCGRFMEEIVEALMHSARGHWGSLKRRPLERPLWRQAVSRGTRRFGVYLRGLVWALPPTVGLWALQRTSYALSGWAADLATAGVLMWAAILLLAVLDRSVSFGTHVLLGLESPAWWPEEPERFYRWGVPEQGGSGEGTVFVTLVGTAEGRAKAELMIDSLRTFGGAMRECPVWLFEADPEGIPCADLAGNGVEVHPLEVPESLRRNWFAGKVWACARAEEMAGPEVHSLVWMAPDCLVIQPPVLLGLDQDQDAAVRPVHHKNIGLHVDEPLDPFWRGVYQAVGVPDVPVTVRSFVDGERLRAYYNSHVLSVRPARGIFRRWLQLFEELVGDQAFQEAACQDAGHQVFLHQAVLSTLLADSLLSESVRTLPPEYSYPYNLHAEVPAGRRAHALNDLVCIAYEDRPLHPYQVDDIEIREPLRSWLLVRMERARAEG